MRYYVVLTLAAKTGCSSIFKRITPFPRVLCGLRLVAVCPAVASTMQLLMAV